MLNRRRGLNLYRGFESLPLRHFSNLRSIRHRESARHSRLKDPIYKHSANQRRSTCRLTPGIEQCLMITCEHQQALTITKRHFEIINPPCCSLPRVGIPPSPPFGITIRITGRTALGGRERPPSAVRPEIPILIQNGGEGGIRTLSRGLSPYDGLAMRSPP